MPWHCRGTEASDWEPLAFKTVMAKGGSLWLDIPDSPGESWVRILRISGEPKPQLGLPPVAKPFRTPPVTGRPRKPAILDRPVRQPNRRPPRANPLRVRPKTEKERAKTESRPRGD